jgi:putative ABC transport system substrate-binding protein
MQRRDFIKVIAGSAVGWPLAARAQQRMRRIGVLMSLATDDQEGQAGLAAFVQGLRDMGLTEGRDVRIDIRWGVGNADDARKYAAELVALAWRHCRGGITPGDPNCADRVYADR